MSAAAVLRLQIERTLEARIPAALSPRQQTAYETASCGIASVDDLLNGGFPIGAISEITGAESSGRTTLALSFLAQRTAEGQVCAWVDVNDTLDPESAAANGVALGRLLWVRCADAGKTTNRKLEARLEQAIRAVDLILNASGFAAVVLDLGGTAKELANRIPLATWFKFRQAAQHGRASLLVLGRVPYGQSSTAVMVECAQERAANHTTVFNNLRFTVRRERQRFAQSISGHRKPPSSTWSASSSWDAARRA